jgi:hypothetical protein
VTEIIHSKNEKILNGGIHCRLCPPNKTRSKYDPQKKKIVICCDKSYSKESMEQIIIKELIVVHDSIDEKKEKNEKEKFCTLIRAYNLSGYCKKYSRNQKKFNQCIIENSKSNMEKMVKKKKIIKFLLGY